MAADPASAREGEAGGAAAARASRIVPRTLLVLAGLAAVVVALAGITEFRGIAGPAFLAAVLVLTLYPIAGALRRRGAPEWLSVAVLLAAAYAVLVALVAGLAFSALQLGLLLPQYSAQFRDLVARALSLLEPMGVTRDDISAAIAGLDLPSLLSGLRPILGGAASAASALLLVAVLVLFLGIDAPGFARSLASTTARPGIVPALETFVERTRRYIVVSTVFGLVVALVDVVLLFALGVPLPVVWGVLSFVTNYVPNVGFVLGVAPPALIALLHGGVGPMVAVVIAYSVVNFVIQSLIQPKVVGDAVGLSATVTFLSLVFWAVVLGPLGGLLAIPLTLFVRAVLVDADPRARWIDELLGGTSRGPAAR